MASQIQFLPPQFQAEEEANQRSQRLAEAMIAQGNAPLQGRQAGGYFVASSPLEGLAKALQGFAGQYGMQRAGEENKGLMGRAGEARQQAIAKALEMAQGSPGAPQNTAGEGTGSFDMSGASGPQMVGARAPNPLGAYGALAATGDPMALQAGTHILGYQQKEKENELNRQARLEERAMQIEAHAQQFALGSAERKAAEQRAQEFRREMMQSQQGFAAQQAAAMRDFHAANRPPEALQQIEDPTSPTGVRLVPRSQAVNQPAPRQERNLTENQGKSALYGTRAAMSDRILNGVEEKISTSGLAAKQAVAKVPLVGGILGAAGNVALSSDQQRVEQAQRDFVNAVLRQESGAVISDSEFANAQKQYFVQPGDSKEVIAQKRQNRTLAVAGFRRMAGPAGPDIDEAVKGTPNLTGTQQRRGGTITPADDDPLGLRGPK